MKEITAYECEYCKQLYRTPHRHECKKNPAKKNCFSCKHSKSYGFYYEHELKDAYCDCDINGQMEDYALSDVKLMNYKMDCDDYEHGMYETDEIMPW